MNKSLNFTANGITQLLVCKIGNHHIVKQILHDKYNTVVYRSSMFYSRSFESLEYAIEQTKFSNFIPVIVE